MPRSGAPPNFCHRCFMSRTLHAQGGCRCGSCCRGATRCATRWRTCAAGCRRTSCLRCWSAPGWTSPTASRAWATWMTSLVRLTVPSPVSPNVAHCPAASFADGTCWHNGISGHSRLDWPLEGGGRAVASAGCLPLLSWRIRAAAGAHEEYLGFVSAGAMLERGDAELQRELGHLLAALTQMQPLLRNLQLEVRRQRCHAATHVASSYPSNGSILPLALGHLQPLTPIFFTEGGMPQAHSLADLRW